MSAHSAAPTAYGYARVSTEEQVAGGVSLDAQRERIRQFCALRGMDLAHIYVDEGVSGGTRLQDRPEGRRLIGAVGACRTRCAVVVVKLDRLSRNVRDFLAVVDDDFAAQGASLFIVDFGQEAVDATSPMGRLLLTQMASFAELERMMIKDRTRTAMQFMRRQGRLVGWRPYGRRLVEGSDTQLEDDPTEQAVIAQIRAWRAAGVTIRGVAALLNETGIPARTCPWTAQRVQDVGAGLHERWPMPANPAAISRLRALQAEGKTTAEIVRLLNDEGLPPHDGVWQKTSVHGIIHGTRVPKEKRRKQRKEAT